MDHDQSGQDNRENSWENARENWEKWQEQEEKKDWDKWDSNASKSSYYNQPTHPPYDQSFSVASLICGFLSVTLSCCYLSLPFGAMGILFAFLCSRRKKALNSNCRLGLCLSIFGCFYGAFGLYVAYTRLLDPSANPAFISFS